jgi:hypothetical protein
VISSVGVASSNVSVIGHFGIQTDGATGLSDERMIDLQQTILFVIWTSATLGIRLIVLGRTRPLHLSHSRRTGKLANELLEQIVSN